MTYDEYIETIAHIIARARFGPGVDMGGKHMPKPSEVQAAKFFVDDHIVELMAKILEYEHALEHVAVCLNGCQDCKNLAGRALEGANREMCKEMVIE